MNLHELTKHIHNVSISNINDNPSITSIEMDSRKVSQGCLFICIKGYTVDGHDFVIQAIKNGAVAILSEKELDVEVPVVLVKDTKRAMAILADVFYQQPSQQLHLIGVTGTNGKTTTTHLIESVFYKHEVNTGMIGTINMKINGKTYPTSNTTPEIIVLQQMFKKMLEENVKAVVMEVSSHALDLGRVRGCDFDVAVFTNLTQDHLDYHSSMEEYKFVKGTLFSSLGNSYNLSKPKFAVLNEDDNASSLYKKLTAGQVVTYGIDKESDYQAKNIQMSPKGTTFELHYNGNKEIVRIKLVGKFSVYNVLACIAACHVSNIPMDTILEAMGEIAGVSGRYELVNEGQDFSVIVDYAHTPDSLENVLTTSKQLVEGKLFCLIGCGGDRDRTKRPLMAQAAVKYSDIPIFTSDNPRTEDPEQIFSDMEKGVEGEQYSVIKERKEAIEYAVSKAKTGDVIIIAGKGHETYQQIGKETLPFDDREVARNAIKMLLNK
ncbi:MULTISPECIES: UDP-N-acetylmuramoyl-L-alanyl-D-glutamate--2,6-diaminopimelate ligase [Bacillus]|uniref:UDP-N-acetylmuramoyl-L-alanyl-D-glutamate--2, 6-diaminopimelate ligase n=1 Tax=Bacillus TaxID=1386 RepID=UPI000BB7B32C|nr:MULTISPECIES: UDP-N-acetylmuramoyl-L-alanyl-D-glutamate--2,6-diaminopimelate ligase [Bacillus]